MEDDQKWKTTKMEVHQHGYWSEVNKEREFCILGTRFFYFIILLATITIVAKTARPLLSLAGP